MNIVKRCAMCEQWYKINEFAKQNSRCYCEFCWRRYSKLSAVARRHGRQLNRRQLHRPARYWKQTPELDAQYLENVA